MGKEQNEQQGNEERRSELMEEVEQLDELSNSVVDLIHSGELDRAEEICHELIRDYPDQADGLHRMASVLVAKKQNQKAAQYYRKAAEFMQNYEGYDPELIQYMVEQAQEMENKIPK